MTRSSPSVFAVRGFRAHSHGRQLRAELRAVPPPAQIAGNAEEVVLTMRCAAIAGLSAAQYPSAVLHQDWAV